MQLGMIGLGGAGHFVKMVHNGIVLADQGAVARTDLQLSHR